MPVGSGTWKISGCLTNEQTMEKEAEAVKDDVQTTCS